VHFFNEFHPNRNEREKKVTPSEALGLGGAASAKLDMILPKILGTNFDKFMNSTELKIVYD
jgi:hypothetical protein